MGAPLRSCDSVEVEASGNSGISQIEFDLLKQSVKDMWIRSEQLFEIFHDPKQPQLGYRMRLKQDLPVKLTVRPDDCFFFGWCANAPPPESPCSHLYERSPVEPNAYMGGPASLCNFVPTKDATICCVRPTSRSLRYMVRLECKNLERGQELVWNYGSRNADMPLSSTGTWFQQCCKILKDVKSIKRLEQRKYFSPYAFVERCVLCGKPFSVNNKECRVQRKPHFMNNHADFLGSNWSGVEPYNKEQEISSKDVVCNADKLNYLIQILTKELKWTVVPACTVITESEKAAYTSSESLVEDFRMRCELLRQSGTLVLRGFELATSIRDLSPKHLEPVPMSVWRNLLWESNLPPQAGIYSVPQKYREECSENNERFVLKFILQKLK